jgi:hypothetical protein
LTPQQPTVAFDYVGAGLSRGKRTESRGQNDFTHIIHDLELHEQ